MARTLFGEELESLTYKTLKNSDFREVSLERDGKTVLKFAIANGFRNIQNLVQKLKRKRCDYDFVEVIAIVSRSHCLTCTNAWPPAVLSFPQIGHSNYFHRETPSNHRVLNV